MKTMKTNLMDTVFANTDFVAEAENYLFYGIIDRAEIEDDVRECMREYDADEEDIQEYTDKIMSVIENR